MGPNEALAAELGRALDALAAGQVDRDATVEALADKVRLDHDRVTTLAKSTAEALALLQKQVDALTGPDPAPVEPATLREAAEAGGFTGDQIPLAAAVAMGESGGFKDAVGDYWQVIPFHTVAAGEWLRKIAPIYKTTWLEMAEFNGIPAPDYVVKTGQRLWNPTYRQRFDELVDGAWVKRYPEWKDGWVDPPGLPVWGPSVSLWQVRTLHRPGDYGPGGVVRDIDKLRDPVAAAEAAYVISQGGEDWSPWTIFRVGQHLKYMDEDYPIRSGFPTANRWNLAGVPAA